MKWLLFLSMFVLSLIGCNNEINMNTQGSEREVTKKKLTIKEIDSLSASANFNFTYNNKPKIIEK